jgi:hypothetical protein
MKNTTQQNQWVAQASHSTYLCLTHDVLLLIFHLFLSILLLFGILKLMIWRVDKITKFWVANALIMVIVYRHEKPLELGKKKGR